MFVTQPIIWRLTDRYGVRKIAVVGVVGGPLVYIGFSLMDGDCKKLFAIAILQLVIGTLTTSPVYTRLVAERSSMRGSLALSIVMVGPPLAGAVHATLFGRYLDIEGWRAGYLLLGIVTLTFDLFAVFLTPRTKPPPSQAKPNFTPQKATIV